MCRTLTGSGGIGKTRIATEVARRLLSEQQEEVWFVDLSPVDSGAFVTGAVAAGFGIAAEQVGDSVAELASRLKARKLLLILDNCEHVIDAAANVVSAILRTCPDVTILATSRERLAVERETGVSAPFAGGADEEPRHDGRGEYVRVVSPVHGANGRD